jgi:hypothetical protein
VARTTGTTSPTKACKTCVRVTHMQQAIAFFLLLLLQAIIFCCIPSQAHPRHHCCCQLCHLHLTLQPQANPATHICSSQQTEPRPFRRPACRPCCFHADFVRVWERFCAAWWVRLHNRRYKQPLVALVWLHGVMRREQAALAAAVDAAAGGAAACCLIAPGDAANACVVHYVL